MHKRFVELKKTLGKFIANFSTVEEDGVTYIYDGEVIREGLAVSTYDERGDVVPLSDGEYCIKGVKVVIVDGLVHDLPDVTPKPAEVQPTTQLSEQTPEVQEQPSEEQTEQEQSAPTADLMRQIKDLEDANAALTAEVAELKSRSAAAPLPQQTEMHPTDRKSDMTGTKYERAAQIFASK